jgi:hypothetical protein
MELRNSEIPHMQIGIAILIILVRSRYFRSVVGVL